MAKLDGKAVIVTGASRGSGAEIARLFAAEGGKVICAARTLREGDHPLEGSLERTVAEIQAAGERVYARFDHAPEPIARRGYRALRRLFLSQLGV